MYKCIYSRCMHICTLSYAVMLEIMFHIKNFEIEYDNNSNNKKKPTPETLKNLKIKSQQKLCCGDKVR